jgi:hydroxysqualene dehydroxylase
MIEAKDVVIIGAGFAGLSAGVALADKGFRVAVLERKPALGGRAYSFADSDTGDLVDNGQHVLMGCYRATLDFLARVGSRDKLVFHQDLEIEMLDGPGKSATVRTAHLPGPLHMAAALMRYKHLSVGERISAMRAGMKLLAMHRRGDAELKQLTVVDLVEKLGQSQRARETFWYPIAIATLNDQPAVSSAALFAEVLKRAFFGRRADSAFVYPKVGLSELYCKSATEIIEKTGGFVEPRATVEALEVGDGGRIASVRLRDGRRLGASNFIAAVPPHHLLRFLPENAVGDPFFARLADLSTSPIVCVHAWFDRPVTESAFVGFIGTTTQWLFNKRRIFDLHGESHPGYLSFVISGARKIVDNSNDELLAMVLADLHRMIPASSDAKLLKALVLKEKQATMAPDLRSHELRPGTETPIPNFLLAGDWIQTGLPATIESAVISGNNAAAAVAARVGA